MKILYVLRFRHDSIANFASRYSVRRRSGSFRERGALQHVTRPPGQFQTPHQMTQFFYHQQFYLQDLIVQKTTRHDFAEVPTSCDSSECACHALYEYYPAQNTQVCETACNILPPCKPLCSQQWWTLMHQCHYLHIQATVTSAMNQMLNQISIVVRILEMGVSFVDSVCDSAASYKLSCMHVVISRFRFLCAAWFLMMCLSLCWNALFLRKAVTGTSDARDGVSKQLSPGKHTDRHKSIKALTKESVALEGYKRSSDWLALISHLPCIKVCCCMSVKRLFPGWLHHHFVIIRTLPLITHNHQYGVETGT